MFENNPFEIPMKLFELKNLNRRDRFRNEAQIRQLCSSAYLGDDRLLCRVLGRYKMFVDARDVGFSSHLLLDGYWEMWVSEVMANIVKPGMKIVDVGANLGYFTLLLADLVGREGQVHAFEPNARLMGLLRQSVAVNGFDAQTHLYEQALGEEEGEAFRLVVPTGEPKNGFLTSADDAAGCEVTTRRLDSYDQLLDADLVKIDADMSERRIWQGMAGLLARQRPLTIMIEFAAIRYADPAGFVDAMLADGFALQSIGITSGVSPTSKAEILAAPQADDIMLMLTR